MNMRKWPKIEQPRVVKPDPPARCACPEPVPQRRYSGWWLCALCRWPIEAQRLLLVVRPSGRWRFDAWWR